MVAANDIHAEDVAAALFTTTPDLNADFPALAARQMGWVHVALMDAHHMAVPGSLPMCLRVSLLVNTTRRQDEIVHIYLRGARVLRPDLVARDRSRCRRAVVPQSPGAVRTETVQSNAHGSRGASPAAPRPGFRRTV